MGWGGGGGDERIWVALSSMQNINDWYFCKYDSPVGCVPWSSSLAVVQMRGVGGGGGAGGGGGQVVSFIVWRPTEGSCIAIDFNRRKSVSLG